MDAIRAVLTSCLAQNTAGVEPDMSLTAYAIQLPDEMTLSQDMSVIDPTALHTAREHVKGALGTALYDEFRTLYDSTAPARSYTFNPAEVGRRRLRNTCLDYLMAADNSLGQSQTSVRRIASQFSSADCMSDKLAALACIASAPADCPERAQFLGTYYDFSDLQRMRE